MLRPRSAEPAHLAESSAALHSCYYHQTRTKTTGCTSVIGIRKWAVYWRPLQTKPADEGATRTQTAVTGDPNITQMIEAGKRSGLGSKGAQKMWSNQSVELEPLLVCTGAAFIKPLESCRTARPPALTLQLRS